MFKIQTFLAEGLRLRTACDLDSVSLDVRRPSGFALPSLADISGDLPTLIKAVADENKFATPRATEIVWKPKAQKKKDGPKAANRPSDDEDAEVDKEDDAE